jgi:hypothetical protein
MNLYEIGMALVFETDPQFIDVVCVKAYVLWMLKYLNLQERKNNRRHLYLLSLGEIMVRSYKRRGADSGNIHILRAMRARDVRYKQPTSPTTVKKVGGRWLGRCSIVQQLRTEEQTGNIDSALNGCARTTLSRKFK